MKSYKQEILRLLIDKYEKSKSFAGTNAVKQSFSIQPEKEFPEYADDARVEAIQAIEEAAQSLEEQELIRVKKHKSGILCALQLNDQKLDACYKLLHRTPKKDINNELISLLDQYRDREDIIGIFSRKQLERLAENKKAEHFNGNVQDYEKILKVLTAITNIPQETYVRDFSVRVLGDSKSFEKISHTVCSILYEYGDFPDKNTILEELNVIKNPGHVYFKGSGELILNSQVLDLDILDGDIAISTSMLKDISRILVTGDSVVTVENLTTFNSYKPDGEFVIYLGGYHNSARRKFIRKLYEQNPTVKYYHYGDIDAGGFYILLHLRNKTGVHFEPLHMDVTTLSSNMEYSKKLTENDEKRLRKLLGGEFDPVITYMLEHNCKLEQEALD